MKRITGEWINKAEGDWHDALSRYTPELRLYLLSRPAMCGEISQGLAQRGWYRVHKTHDLPLLLTLATRVEPQWAALQQQTSALNGYAVDLRYPGKSATKAEAKQAIEDCREVRRAVRTAFGLPI